MDDEVNAPPNKSVNMTYTPPRALRQPIGMGQLLKDLVEKHGNVIILACCSRNFFLDQIVRYLSMCTPSDPGQADIEDTSLAGNEANSTGLDAQSKAGSNIEQPRSALLSNTLANLVSNEKSKILFCPTLQAFRATLATLPVHVDREDLFDSVYIIDMISLHHGTADFTVQGLSRTFALLTSIGHHCHATINLVECKNIKDDQDPHRGHKVWDIEVPLLSGSVKIGQAGQGWAARKTSIQRFAGKWIQFVQP